MRPPAPLFVFNNRLDGTYLYNETIDSICNDPVCSVQTSFNLNIGDNGKSLIIDNGFLTVTTSQDHFNTSFVGAVYPSNLTELQIQSLKVNDLEVSISNFSNINQLDGMFIGEEGEAFLGAFSLNNGSGSHVEGAYITKESNR